MDIDPRMEMEIQMAIDGASQMNKNVIFPKVRHLMELFDEVRVITDETDCKGWMTCSWELDEGGECHVGSYCRVSGHEFNYGLDVAANDDVLDAIQENMLTRRDYVINFEIIVREGGAALVLARYDRILGDRWFAIIDPATIPGLAEARAQEKADEEMVKDLEEPAPSDEPPLLEMFPCRNP